MPPSKQSKGKGKGKGKARARKPATSSLLKAPAREASNSPESNHLDGGRERNISQPPQGEPARDLTQEHSFEQMRIVALALISRIAFDRNLFPNLNYELRRYDPADPDPSYQSFVDGANVPLLTEHVKNWKVLPHGAQKGVDQLLNWLEQGISDAIEQGYLKKFEFTIHSKDEDKICHSNMLESYAMSFTYGPEPQIEFSSTNGIPETLDVAKAMVYELVENFSKAYRARMATAEPLPRFVRLGMILLYNNNCPRHYAPPLFRAGDDETLKMLRDGNSDTELNLNTGFHEVSIGWSVKPQVSNHSSRYTSNTRLEGLEDRSPEGVNSPAQATKHIGRMQQVPQPAQRISSSLKRIVRPVPRQSSILRHSQNENIKLMQGWQRHRSRRDLTHDTQYLSSSPFQIASRPVKGSLLYTPEINERARPARVDTEARDDGGERSPSMVDENSPGYQEASRMHSSGKDDGSSTASDEFPSTPENYHHAVSGGCQMRSGFKTFSPARPLERKRKSDASPENSTKKSKGRL